MTAEAVLPFDALVVEEPDFSAKPLHRHPAGKTSDSVGYGNLSDKINENNFKGSSPKKAYPKIGTSEFEAFSRSLDKRPLRYRVVKRIFDIVFSLVIIFVCIFCWPITLALLMTIAVQTKGFPFYVQERVGLHGKPIKICKLRSMVRDSDNIEKYLQEEMLEQWHKERKVDNDPRIVPVGHFIRKTSIDEFANVFNVLLGQMSVIGPRPVTFDEMEWYSSYDQAKLLSVPGGITGMWQCTRRNNATFESGERQKIELKYIYEASFLTDAKIFVRTFKTMLEKTGR